MSSLKVIATVLSIATPVAPLTGSLLITDGAVVSGAALVVKFMVYALARPLPAASSTAPAGTVTV
ncbi:MAG: hypothetical protein A4E53_02868 [Pelotomaculum sp. PtaB.Bin104]|nr:MAG: hypothetical protein A4E53_02868 [Pelotomaculum sp. PtaB.Bin104]